MTIAMTFDIRTALTTAAREVRLGLKSAWMSLDGSLVVRKGHDVVAVDNQLRKATDPAQRRELAREVFGLLNDGIRDKSRHAVIALRTLEEVALGLEPFGQRRGLIETAAAMSDLIGAPVTVGFLQEARSVSDSVRKAYYGAHYPGQTPLIRL
jgi:hypothetical protein